MRDTKVVGSLFGGRKGIRSEKGTANNIPIVDGLTELATNIANGLVPLIRTEQDLWWFVMEQYYRLIHSTTVDAADKFQPHFVLNLHEVEYTWGKTEPFVVNVSNRGIFYLEEQVIPVLSKRFGDDVAEMTVSYAFSQYCLTYQEVINRIRLEFAVHFRDSCRSGGHLAHSEQWQAVVNKLGGE